MPRVREIEEDGGDPILKASFDRQREIYGGLLNPAKVMHVGYTAIEGRSAGPPLFSSLSMLGRESSLKRLRAARARL